MEYQLKKKVNIAMAQHCTYEQQQVNGEEICNWGKTGLLCFKGEFFSYSTITHFTSTTDIFSIHFSHLTKANVEFPKLWSSDICKTQPKKITLLHTPSKSYGFKPLQSTNVVLVCTTVQTWWIFLVINTEKSYIRCKVLYFHGLKDFIANY